MRFQFTSDIASLEPHIRTQSLRPITSTRLCEFALALASFILAWTVNTMATSARREKTPRICGMLRARRRPSSRTNYNWYSREIIIMYCAAERTLLIWTVQIKPIDIEFYWEMWYSDEVTYVDVERRRHLCGGSSCTEWCYRLNGTQIALKNWIEPIRNILMKSRNFSINLLISMFFDRPTPPLDMHIGINLVAVFFWRSEHLVLFGASYCLRMNLWWWVIWNSERSVRETERCQLKYSFYSVHIDRRTLRRCTYFIFIIYSAACISTLGCLQSPQRQCGVGGQQKLYLNISRVRCATCVLLCTQQPNVNKIDLRFRDNIDYPVLRVANKLRIKGSDRKQYRITHNGNKCQSIYLAFSLSLFSSFRTMSLVSKQTTNECNLNRWPSLFSEP